jgi:hypothetical protein
VVSRVAQAVIGLVNVADIRETRRDLARVIGRAVVDQDDFVMRIVDFAQRLETLGQRLCPVVGTDDDRNERIAG